jgi:predicted ATP-dependent endonuclease of OLD family
MTPWVNEGFFSDVVVLVEGEEDRAWILGTAASLGHDFDGLGISVIPCNGKNNLDRPYVVFTGLTIPTYLVWDGDKDATNANPEVNQLLLRLVRAADEAWPPVRVTNSYAVFQRDLPATSREEMGAAAYDAQVTAAIGENGMSTKADAFKNPFVVETLVRRMRDTGLRSPTIEAIVDAVVAMRSQH